MVGTVTAVSAQRGEAAPTLYRGDNARPENAELSLLVFRSPPPCPGSFLEPSGRFVPAEVVVGCRDREGGLEEAGARAVSRCNSAGKESPLLW